MVATSTTEESRFYDYIDIYINKEPAPEEEEEITIPGGKGEIDTGDEDGTGPDDLIDKPVNFLFICRIIVK